MPRPVDGVHDHFHETTEYNTVEKNGVVSKNSRRRVQCLNKECLFNQVYRNVLQLQTHLAAPTSGPGSENRCQFASSEMREYYQGALASSRPRCTCAPAWRVGATRPAV